MFFNKLLPGINKKVGSSESLKSLVTGRDARYHVLEFEGKFLIQTDWQAPLFRVFITDADKPGRENWEEFIPESKDKLDERRGINLAAGYIFARYLSNASSKIKIFDKSGRYLRDLPLKRIAATVAERYHSTPGFARLIVDHLAGMSDRFALEEFRALQLPSPDQDI